MSAVSELGKSILDAAAPALARGAVSLLKVIFASKDPAGVTKRALAEATKASAEAELQASFAAKRAAGKSLKR